MIGRVGRKGPTFLRRWPRASLTSATIPTIQTLPTADHTDLSSGPFFTTRGPRRQSFRETSCQSPATGICQGEITYSPPVNNLLPPPPPPACALPARVTDVESYRQTF